MRPEDALANSDVQTGAIASRAHKSERRDIIIVLMVAWATRLAFICLIPSGSRSWDAYSWQKVAEFLKDGANPYQASVFLSWPPLWMQIIFAISRIADLLHVPFFQVLRITLILFESALIVQVMRLIKMLAPAANARAIVMVGIALNPVAILLICQHCNFDVIMALWVLLAAEGLVRYNQSHNLMDWLCACLFLGLGILTKTVPLALVPLLAGGFREATAGSRLLGACLLLGPTILGMSVIYVLTPAAVVNHVLEYHPDRTTFGFPGLMHLTGIDDFANYFDRAFYVLGFVVLALSWSYLWKRHSFGNHETILYIAMILLAIPVLGPGFGSQYCYWFLPFLVISYACYAGLWRKLLLVVSFIAAVTFIVEYGFNAVYGCSFLFLLSHATSLDMLHQWSGQPKGGVGRVALQWAIWISTPDHKMLEWTLLFIALLAVLAFGARTLLITANAPRKWVRTVAGCYAFYIIIVFGLGWTAKYIQQKSASSASPNSGQSDRITSP